MLRGAHQQPRRYCSSTTTSAVDKDSGYSLNGRDMGGTTVTDFLVRDLDGTQGTNGPGVPNRSYLLCTGVIGASKYGQGGRNKWAILGQAINNVCAEIPHLTFDSFLLSPNLLA